MVYETNGPSKLSDGNIYYNGGFITIQEFRDMISTRNTYSLDNEYEYNNNLSLRNKGKIAESIGSILNVIPQFNSGIENSLASRILGNNTPLTDIGTVMLGKQMFYNSVSHLSQQYLPSVDLSLVLKGKSPFVMPIDFSITNNINANLLDKITSAAFYKTNSFSGSYPFTRDSTNIQYIENTGNAQLRQLFTSINRNFYKQISEGYGDTTTQTLIKYSGDDYANTVLNNQSLVSLTKYYYNFNDVTQNPYLSNILFNSIAIDTANSNMRISISSTEQITQEYAPNIDYIKNNFGTTNKSPIVTIIDDYVNSSDSDDIIDKIVWGRDGVDKNAEENLSNLHGDTTYEQNNVQLGGSTLNTEFNVNSGLLEYTRNLLNASSGQYVDITRKAFKSGEKIVGFNGSPLWKSNNSTYAQSNSTAGKTGTRQHSILDQYNRFTKAIRFNGNSVYNGNENSVIYKSVLPKIHPIRNERGVDTKNMMFSIENLALTILKDDKFGIIEDDGSPIPLTEIGPSNGRIMWFPPYDLQINETASAKHDSTVMVGRSEPMYSYMNSERTASLNFTLLVDYPPQMKAFINDNNYKKNSADFFAFGGDPIPIDLNISEIDLQISLLERKINELTSLKSSENIDINNSDITLYFQNDMPDVSQQDTVFDIMYNNPNHYEIADNCESGNEGVGFGLNKNIYYISGLTKINNKWELDPSFYINNPDFSQYNVGLLTQQNGFGVNKLNEMLIKLFTNEENRKFITIVIVGSASKLNDGVVDYNENLGMRRANAAKKLVEERLKAIFKINSTIGFNFGELRSIGSNEASDDGSSSDNMNKLIVKSDRKAVISFIRNDSTSNVVTVDNSDEVSKLQDEITSLETKRNILKKFSVDVFNLRNENDEILKTFEAANKNYFHPIYNSQTPEDFHRRLTFLHQCTRQGPSKRYNVKNGSGGSNTRNSVFGRQPICILRVGDFFHTKVIIDSINIDYNETTWDMNPEGFGLQPMLARITLQLKLIGGQSLKGPIDALQNAASFNYYANSTFKTTGMYKRSADIEASQIAYKDGISNNITKK